MTGRESSDAGRSGASFTVFPAIDLLGGRCVRLYQGDYDRATAYGDDPAAQAAAFCAEGAQWLHVVDLDAARTGEQVNLPAVEAIAAVAADAGVPVQVGGGVRSVPAARSLIDRGVTRVVLGTAALEDPGLVATLAADHRVAVGLDGRGGEVAVRGWLESSGRTVLDVAEQFAGMGVDALIVTDIARDGTLGGPDIDGLVALLERVAVPVIASGGVATAGDVTTLATVERAGRRLAGVIVGRALYEGACTLPEAIAAGGGS
jgi:phosphoribosylformimino-5-aminoimidazole carboxamide ribotide isomerase